MAWSSSIKTTRRVLVKGNCRSLTSRIRMAGEVGVKLLESGTDQFGLWISWRHREEFGEVFRGLLTRNAWIRWMLPHTLHCPNRSK